MRSNCQVFRSRRDPERFLIRVETFGSDFTNGRYTTFEEPRTEKETRERLLELDASNIDELIAAARQAMPV
jgi:hypothetical protein